MMMMMVMIIRTIMKKSANLLRSTGLLAEVSVCHVWMRGLGEPNALFSGTVARWDSKKKENSSRHTLPLASLAVPRQEILPLIVK